MQKIPYNEDDVVARECKHAHYVEGWDKQSDLLAVKEVVHLKSGETIPTMRYIRDYQRDFWVTLPGYRNHTEKKEFEDVSKLQKFTCAQHQLSDRIATALELHGGGHTTLRRLARSPYLYGADVTTPVLIKQRYMQRWPDAKSRSTVAFIDIETDVLKDPNLYSPICVTMTFKNRAIMAVVKSMIKTTPLPEESIRKTIDKYLNDYMVKRKIDLEIVLVDTPGQAIQKVFQRAHEWGPDFLAAWNMHFDITNMIKALEREGIKPADVFCDPDIPRNFRKFKFIEAPDKKVTATGKVTPQKPWERWHQVVAPASFYIIDSMATYHKLRFQVEGMQDSYALGDTLNRHLGIRKLNFDVADGLKGLDWHEFMQSKYPLEYLAYNLFDCIGGELLDEEVHDLSTQITNSIEASEYGRYPSTPRRLVDDNHFEFLNEGKVIGTTSDQMVHELDAAVVGMEEWIITLPSHLVKDNGVELFFDLPGHKTEVRLYVADLDVKSAYPNGQQIMNISKATTIIEVCGIQGQPQPAGEALMRKCSLNMVGGTVNAIEFCQDLYGAPSMTDLLEAYKREKVVSEQ